MQIVIDLPKETYEQLTEAGELDYLEVITAIENGTPIPNGSGDLISRQAAIDALHVWFSDGFEEDRWWNSTHVLAAIEGLPSAQPEIIHCRDCKYWKIDHPTANGYHCCWRMHNIFPMGADDFCSRAESREDAEDITYCYYNKCSNKKCERHSSNIKKHYVPHSFDFFKDCAWWDMPETYFTTSGGAQDG